MSSVAIPLNKWKEILSYTGTVSSSYQVHFTSGGARYTGDVPYKRYFMGLKVSEGTMVHGVDTFTMIAHQSIDAYGISPNLVAHIAPYHPPQ